MFQPLIKGRCLSLKEGKLESTESIYSIQAKIDKNDLAPLKVKSQFTKQNAFTYNHLQNVQILKTKVSFSLRNIPMRNKAKKREKFQLLSNRKMLSIIN